MYKITKEQQHNNKSINILYVMIEQGIKNISINSVHVITKEQRFNNESINSLYLLTVKYRHYS
jgi:hypothetical protein